MPRDVIVIAPLIVGGAFLLSLVLLLVAILGGVL
jgi:hypothetical protein